jgi:insertion element IS1 protein InsB
LAPFGIGRFDTDDWGSDPRHLNSEPQAIGQENTQKIERKHLTLRTRSKRLARKTPCFSQSVRMHDMVIGLFMNRDKFGLQM